MSKIQLPENYQQAERALAQLVKVDEVKDILDKGVAMQTYALQAKDDSLIRKASQARWLATNRLEELVEEARAAGRLAKGSRGSIAGKQAGTGPGKGKGKGKAKAGKPKDTSGGSSSAPPEEIITVKGLPRNLLTQMRKLGKLSKPERKTYINEQIAVAVAKVSGDKDALKGAKGAKTTKEKTPRAESQPFAFILAGKLQVTDKAVLDELTQAYAPGAPRIELAARKVGDEWKVSCAVEVVEPAKKAKPKQPQAEKKPATEAAPDAEGQPAKPKRSHSKKKPPAAPPLPDSVLFAAEAQETAAGAPKPFSYPDPMFREVDEAGPATGSHQAAE